MEATANTVSLQTLSTNTLMNPKTSKLFDSHTLAYNTWHNFRQIVKQVRLSEITTITMYATNITFCGSYC